MTIAAEEIVSFAPEEMFRESISCRFARLKPHLESIVEGAEIHHVGSTAIPGTLTKGDLDIQIRVSAERFPRVAARLKELYTVNEGGFSGADAISFEDRSEVPSVGIHLTVTGGAGDVQVRFRDLLIDSESLRGEYDDLKRRFDGGSMDTYRTAKAEFVSRVLSSDPNFRE